MKYMFLRIIWVGLIIFLSIYLFQSFVDYQQELEDKKILDAKLEILRWVDKDVTITDIEPEAEVQIQRQEEIPKEIYTAQTTSLSPEQYDTDIKFHSQSPFATWWPIFWETCEEASILLAVSFFRWLDLSAEEFRDELLSMVDWQKKEYGKYDHTSVDETSWMLKEYFWYTHFEVKNNPTIDSMKQELAKGNLIAAPFYGVGMNPYYSDGWPQYHFLLIKWYTSDSFITHDVGTKRGENYVYPYTEIIERLHDYHPDDIQKWAKKILVIKPS